MNENELYEKGYADGFHDVAAHANLVLDDTYRMGYEDGCGDRENGAKPMGVKSAFINDDFYILNEPPVGYSWAQEFRTPQRGEIYLTKNGNAGVAKSEPKNGRQRQMLTADVLCRRSTTCNFASGHTGRCSGELLK